MRKRETKPEIMQISIDIIIPWLVYYIIQQKNAWYLSRNQIAFSGVWLSDPENVVSAFPQGSQAINLR